MGPHLLRERLACSPPLLYVLLDAGLVAAGTLVREGVELAEAGADVIQLRGKQLGGGQLWEIARTLLRPLQALSVPLIINDRLDVALAAQAEGVHLGAEDLPTNAARALLGSERIIGATAHSLAELRACGSEVDYVGFGAVYSTTTRAGSCVCGPEALTAACRASTLPVIAIGGLGPDNLSSLRGRGLAGIAVASSVSPRHAHPGAVEDLKRQLQAW